MACQVSITTTHHINLGGKKTWNIQAHESTTVDHTVFIKMPSSSYTFTRLLAEGVCEEDHVAMAAGLQELIAIRNEAQGARMSSASALFRNARTTRSSRATLKRLRESREIMHITIPAYDGFPSFETETLAPAHPNDALYMKLDSDVISNIIGFIRSRGLEGGARRAYRQSNVKGVWTVKDYFLVKSGHDARARKAGTLEEAVGLINGAASEDGEAARGCTQAIGLEAEPAEAALEAEEEQSEEEEAGGEEEVEEEETVFDDEVVD